MTIKLGAYTAVPLETTTNPVRRIENDSSEWRYLKSPVPLLVTLALLSVLFVGLGASGKSPSLTLLPGGGRDWVLNLEEGTISPKHNKEFAIGVLESSPLVLTRKDSDNVIRFDKEKLSALSEGVPQMMEGIGLNSPSDQDFKGLLFWLLTSSGPEESLTLEYKESNFIVVKERGQEYVLDISFGKYEPGNTVNFLRAPESSPLKTFQSGGGRDWIIDLEEGIISPKHEPMLALGRGVQQLQLHPRGTKNVWKFDNLEKLKNGEPMKMINTDGLVMGKLENEENTFFIWRYILSSKVNDPEKAISLKYIDDNYLAVYEKDKPKEDALVLDVSFWKMFNFNSINYVGGYCYDKCDGKFGLRKYFCRKD